MRSEKKRISDALYALTHRAERQEAWRRYRLKKLAEDPEWDAKRCRKDAEKRARRACLYRKERIVHRREVAARWRENNRDTWREANRKRTARFAEARPERVREIKSANTAKRRSAPGKLSYGIIPKLKRQQNNRCAYCLKEFGAYHIDHIYPLSKGGRHEDSNIQLLCPRCNLTKSNKIVSATQAAAVLTALRLT